MGHFRKNLPYGKTFGYISKPRMLRKEKVRKDGMKFVFLLD